MRRSAAALALARRLCSSGQAPALTAAAGRLLQCGASGASRSPVAAAAAALQRPSWRCFSAEGGSGGESGGSSVPGGREAWEAVSQLSAEATQMAEEGDPAGAKQRLKEGGWRAALAASAASVRCAAAVMHRLCLRWCRYIAARPGWGAELAIWRLVLLPLPDVHHQPPCVATAVDQPENSSAQSCRGWLTSTAKRTPQWD